MIQVLDKYGNTNNDEGRVLVFDKDGNIKRVGGGGGTGTVTSVSVTNGTGITATVANPTSTPNITITNTAPDQTVVLNNGTGISVTGTYPNFTITNTGSSPTGAALTKTDDTNVTLTLGGSPSTALLAATSLTLGWTGTLADSRIASASTWNGKQNALSGTGIVKSTSGTISYLTDNTANWDTAYTNRITSLTTTGSSGSATLSSNTLNIPTYTLSGLGGVPTSRTLSINGTSYDLTADRSWSVGTVTSVGLSMPTAFSVASSPVTTSGTIAVTGAGLVSQYVRGDGTLANFPISTGGGSSVSYYLNGSVNQGTFGGVTYYEINGTPVIGAGTDFTINADGYIAQFITDVADPNKLLIPAGNWNFETYFSASSNGGSPSFYIELYKVSATNVFTLITSNSATPENITGGTSIDLYFTAIAVPSTVLLATDRLAVRFYVTHSGRTIKMHTEDSHLSQIITTFSTGLTALNGLTAQVQSFANDTNVTMVSSGSTHTITWAGTLADARIASATTWNAKQNTRSVNVVSIATAAGSTAGTDYVYLVSGTTTVTLPTAVGNTNLYTIKRVGTNTVSIATTSSQTIDGSSSPITINVQNVSLDLISNGSNWNII